MQPFRKKVEQAGLAGFGDAALGVAHRLANHGVRRSRVLQQDSEGPPQTVDGDPSLDARSRESEPCALAEERRSRAPAIATNRLYPPTAIGRSLLAPPIEHRKHPGR